MGSRPFAPRVILIDIESSPVLGFAWGKYEQNLLHIKRDWQLLSFAYKELGRAGVSCLSRPQFKDKTDREITRAIWKVVDESDVLIAHNGDSFDVPKLRAKFVEHGLPPTRPFKTIDTKKIAKSQFRFTSNSLNDLAALLGLGEKIDTGGFQLWLDCMAGKRDAWRRMVKYNRHDVVLLEQVYERLKAWHPTHPNLALYEDRPGCPACSSLRIQRRGFNVKKASRAPRFQCQECGHWFASVQIAKALAA